MKITKSSKEAASFKAAKIAANAGCNVCPCCGENRSQLDYLRDGITMKGVSDGICKNWIEGFFRVKYMQTDCYKCYTCGAEWESKPYEVEIKD